MLAYGLPIAVTLFIWWFSTGAILFLDGLPRQTFRWSMAAASLATLAALYGLSVSSHDTSVGGIYLAFGSAMMVWAWNEMAFLMGYITGPRREPCPPATSPFQRFSWATQSIIYHELAILMSAGLIAHLTWSGANQFGLWTFILLWLMRLSTKFNIFLGVPNTTIDFLPAHLAYLKSYFAFKPMNLLFPASVSVSTAIAMKMAAELAVTEPGSGLFTGTVLLLTLMVLAIIEHWFLVIPLPFGELWSWGLSSRTKDAPAVTPEMPTPSLLRVVDGPNVTALAPSFPSKTPSLRIVSSHVSQSPRHQKESCP